MQHPMRAAFAALFSLVIIMPALAQQAKAPAPAGFSQSRVIIGGVDQRVPPLESQILAQQLAEKAQQLARAAALLSIEGQDHKEADERAAQHEKDLALWFKAWFGTP